jgi:serine/threonine protein kinase
MYDFGITGEEVYIAMEFVEGPTLRDLIYERIWNAKEIHLVIGQIAQALAAAHRQNIVHRDLKPENVILVAGAGGQKMVKVLDFGLAKLAELERKLGLEPLTRAGMCFGTPQYMAPELIKGRAFDRTVDLYALGVIAFELIGGFLPWDGIDPREVLISVVRNPPPRIAHAHSSIANVAAVDKFLQRVLSKSASDRPPDAATFFRDFEQAVFGDKRPPKVAKVPADDEAFATVWAVSLDLRPSEDATEVDKLDRFAGRSASGEVTRPGERPGTGTKRRLASGWMQNLSGIEGEPHDPISDSRDTDEDLRAAARKVVLASDDEHLSQTSQRPAHRPDEDEPEPAAIPVAATVYGPRTDHTEMIHSPDGRGRASMLWWLVPLLLGLVVFAAALGYVVGKQR